MKERNQNSPTTTAHNKQNKQTNKQHPHMGKEGWRCCPYILSMVPQTLAHSTPSREMCTWKKENKYKKAPPPKKNRRSPQKPSRKKKQNKQANKQNNQIQHKKKERTRKHATILLFPRAAYAMKARESTRETRGGSCAVHSFTLLFIPIDYGYSYKDKKKPMKINKKQKHILLLLFLFTPPPPPIDLCSLSLSLVFLFCRDTLTPRQVFF